MESEKVRTSNIVASVSFGCPLDLVVIFAEFGEEKCKYKPSKFHGLIYKSKKCTFNIYSNGSVLCTGASRFKIVKQSFSRLRKCLHKIGFKVKKYFEIKIGNYVGTFQLDNVCKTYLSTIYVNVAFFRNFASRNLVIFEPDRFCAITWYSKRNVTVVAFRTGRCIVTGCKTQTDQQLAVTEFLGEFFDIHIIFS